MAATEVPSVVSDAVPLIHLDELGCLDLINSLGTLFIPQEVWEEVLNHRQKLRLEELSHARIVKDISKPSVQLQSLYALLWHWI
jgi:hypothetical protein